MFLDYSIFIIMDFGFVIGINKSFKFPALFGK